MNAIPINISLSLGFAASRATQRRKRFSREAVAGQNPSVVSELIKNQKQKIAQEEQASRQIVAELRRLQKQADDERNKGQLSPPEIRAFLERTNGGSPQNPRSKFRPSRASPRGTLLAEHLRHCAT